MALKPPSMDQWLAEAKQDPDFRSCGMYLVHNGVVRETPKRQVREGATDAGKVGGMLFSYDAEKVEQALADARQMPGISYVRAWLNEGELSVGDDIRPRVIDALQTLVGTIKNECVSEIEREA